MPNRQYVPSGGRWPLWLDHLWAHIHEATTAALAVVMGVLMIAGAISPTFDPSPSVAALPPVYGYLIGAFLAGGGVINLFATLTEFRDRSLYWLFKRLGLLAGLLGWTGYGLAAALQRPDAITPWFFGFGFLTLHTLSMVRTFLDEYRIRKVRKEEQTTYGTGR